MKEVMFLCLKFKTEDLGGVIGGTVSSLGSLNK